MAVLFTVVMVVMFSCVAVLFTVVSTVVFSVRVGCVCGVTVLVLFCGGGVVFSCCCCCPFVVLTGSSTGGETGSVTLVGRASVAGGLHIASAFLRI